MLIIAAVRLDTLTECPGDISSIVHSWRSNSIWTLWSRSNWICWIYFPVWYIRFLLAVRVCVETAENALLLLRCWILKVLNTGGFGPYDKHGGLGSGVFDLAIIGAESSLCKMNVGNSSVLLYNNWRLAQLEKQACRTVFFFSSSSSTIQKQSSPVTLTLPLGHTQPGLNICGSRACFHMPSPNTDMSSAFPSAKKKKKKLSLNCNFLGSVCCVCECVWRGFTAPAVLLQAMR